MSLTKQLIVDLSQFPCSVIIIGVGSEDFKNMYTLDAGQHGLTDDQGRKSTRDIVQFVEFNKAI